MKHKKKKIMIINTFDLKYDSSKPEENAWWNRDSAVFRFRNGTTRVVGDVELAETFKKRGNDDFWREIYCIQSIVKSKIGIGQHIFVDFVAPINEDSPYIEIPYNFRQYGNDSELEIEDYWLKQWYKIWYYIQKLYSYEILKMKSTFLKDDNNKIWLHYIKDIKVRKLQNREHSWPFWLKYELNKNDNREDSQNSKYSKLKLSKLNSRSLERNDNDDNRLISRIYNDFIKLRKN